MSRRIYSWLLRLYPEDFRKHYGDEAARLFAERFRDETGLAARIRFCFDILVDLAFSLPREHAFAETNESLVRPASGHDNVPSLYIFEDRRPRSSALLSGFFLSIALLSGFAALLAAGHEARAISERWLSGGGLGWFGRTAPTDPSFETASIKRVEGGGKPSIAISPGGRVTAENVTVKRLMRWAFEVQDFQIEDGPAWMESEPYEVTAQAPGENRPDKLAIMMQTLLRERMKLDLVWRPMELPIYALDRETGSSPVRELSQGAEGPSRVTSGPCGVQLTFPAGASMAQLANFLSRQSWIGRPVLDRTGLPEIYDIKLEWSPDGPMSLVDGGFESGSPPPPPPPPSSGGSSCPARLSLKEALHRQLGLKLTPLKTTVAILSVAHLERPSSN